MKKKILLFAVVITFTMLTLTGCFPGREIDEAVNAGFFLGFWHGMIALISLIGSIFNPDISLYEINNNGFWYNLGFYLAITGVSIGGISIGRIRIGGRR